MTKPRTPPANSQARVGIERRRHWDGVTMGVHVPSDAEHLERLRAWALVLPDDAAFTGLTAVTVQRWWLPPLPSDVPVFAAHGRTRPRPRRSGLRVMRWSTAPPVENWYGLRLTSAPETLLACARVLSLLDLVVVTDGALRAAACSLADLAHLVDDPVGARATAGVGTTAGQLGQPVATYRVITGRPGITLLREAVALADSRSESPWETLLRVLHVSCGIEVEPQARLTLSDGARVRADLRLVGTRTLHEYDGEHHRTREGHRSDLRRDRRLLTDGWARRGYTSTDLIHRPEQILREADAALGRPHDPARLGPWLGMLGDSLFTARGTAGFRARVGLPLTPG